MMGNCISCKKCKNSSGTSQSAARSRSVDSGGSNGGGGVNCFSGGGGGGGFFSDLDFGTGED